MTLYRRFIETNDHEGATWDWWLQTDGNEIPMAHLSAHIQARREQDDWYSYKLTEDLLPEHDVDVLVEHAEENYFPLSNRVDGTLTLPEALDDEFDEKLYKGGIRDFFQGGTE